MLTIQRFVCNMLQENCYVVSDETRQCVIVDCGAYYPEEKAAIKEYISENNLTPVHLLATHGHLDHNFGNKFIDDEYGLKVELHKDDEDYITHYEKQADKFFQLDVCDKLPPVGRLLEDKDTIDFGSHHFTVVATPGHSQGGVFFYCEEEKVCFSGDTLFQGSIGRTDLGGGSMFMLIQSLRTICQWPDDVVVLPGHGNVMGYGVIRVVGNKAEMVAMGVIDLHKMADPYLRLGHIFERVTGIIDSYLPDEMAIEAPFFGKNVQSMLKLGRAQGVAIAAAINHGVPIHEYAPMKIKVAITGNGSASKEQVAGMLQRMLHLNAEEMPSYMDATDALGAAYCHFLQLGRPASPANYRGWKDFINKNRSRVSEGRNAGSDADNNT